MVTITTVQRVRKFAYVAVHTKLVLPNVRYVYTVSPCMLTWNIELHCKAWAFSLDFVNRHALHHRFEAKFIETCHVGLQLYLQENFISFTSVVFLLLFQWWRVYRKNNTNRRISKHKGQIKPSFYTWRIDVLGSSQPTTFMLANVIFHTKSRPVLRHPTYSQRQLLSSGA